MIAYDAIASEKRTPLFAIIIGINNYEDASLSKLSRSVPDAEAINEYLQTDLKVPSNQIIVLCNKEASRANILDAFEKMKRDTRIQKDDPILIYYAGHASELTRETGDPIQVIFPQDYNQESEVKAIPDCKIVALLDDLAETHGNNITVILDCCHSGTLNRGEDNEEDPRADTRANGFARRGVRSHVLLAAFSANEQAREGADACKGRFTVALLELLRATGAERLVYADVLRYINPISGQKPRCEGYYRNRAFFDAKVVSPSRTYYYDVKVENGKYILLAGSAHGIAEGDEFTIYKDQDAIMAEHSLAVMRVSEVPTRNGVSNIQAFTTVLSPPPDLSQVPFGPNGLAVALHKKMGTVETFFLHVSPKETFLPIFKAAVDELQDTGSTSCHVALVPRENAQIEVLLDKKGFNLATLDPLLVASGTSRLPHTLEPNFDGGELQRVLRVAAQYTLNLNRTRMNNHIEKNKIKFKLGPILGQNTQSGGYHRICTSFNPEVTSPPPNYYHLKLEAEGYILKAGSVHGVTKGAEFTIYKDQDAIVADDSLAVMKVSEMKNGIGGIQAFTTTLSPPPDLPGLTFGPNGLAIAVQTKIGMAETFLLHVPLKENCVPIFSAIADELGGIGRNACRVMLVDRERAEMEMLVDRKGFTLATLDPRLVASGIYRLPHTLEPNVDATKLRRVLRAAAHYTFNLNHTHANNLIEKKIEIQFKQLFGKTNEWDEDSLPVVTPGSANLVRGDKIDFIPEVDGIYGFEIKNDTPWNLYVCCFYFDSMDLSIVALTPVANRGRSTQDFMLPGKGGTATIGYGPSAIAPVVFDPLPQGIAVAGGYFKFYFTTVSLNLSPTAEALNHSHVPKTARADDSRPGGMRKIRPRVPPPTWGTITLPVIRRRAQ